MPIALAPALLISGLVGAGASVASGVIGSKAAKSAAQTQADSAAAALDFQKQEFATEQANEAPWLAEGRDALATLATQLPQLTAGFDPTKAGLPAQAPSFNSPAPFSYGVNDFRQDPGYQFALDQGKQAIERSAAAKGGSLSGGALKSLDQYTTGLADQQYNEAYQRAQGTYQQNFGDLLAGYNSKLGTYQTNY
ncbi:MAG: hypothetical protein ACRD9L_05985, partial [Bryobacteraceae bacterium]